MAWSYDARSARYRDMGSGRYLSKGTVVKLRDEAVDAATKEARTLAEKVANGSLSPSDFGAEMRKLMKTVHIAQYELGRGGMNAMTASDRGALGRVLRTEYAFLDKFVRELSAPDLDPVKVADRAALYTESSLKSYHRGLAAAHGIETPDEVPPVHPACRCSLSVSGDAWVWTTADDPCPICSALASQYQGVAA